MLPSLPPSPPPTLTAGSPTHIYQGHTSSPLASFHLTTEQATFRCFLPSGRATEPDLQKRALFFLSRHHCPKILSRLARCTSNRSVPPPRPQERGLPQSSTPRALGPFLRSGLVAVPWSLHTHEVGGDPNRLWLGLESASERQ